MTNYGLSSAEVNKSLNEYGNNSLPQPPRETFMDKFIGNFNDPIIKILIFALVVNAIFVMMGHGEWIETIGIFAAIILATLVSTYSEYSNENAFQKLQEEASRISCKVWRNNDLEEIHIDDIVVGDAVVLEAGDKIPVDGILLEGNLKVDQATLNGESEEAKKIVAPEGFVWAEQIDFLDKNRLYRGSVVVEGQGIMKAVKVGADSIYGQLTQELKDDERDSPLKLKLKGLATQISYFGYGGGIFIAVAIMIHKMLLAGGLDLYLANTTQVVSDLVQAIILAVIIIVMAVPEGLPLMIAIVSSLNMKKMLKDNVLVRTLMGIETAGSLNILFTDKTGTITKGKLEVVSFITGAGEELASFEVLPETIKQLAYENAILNTSASVTEGKILGGNMTEQAINKYIGDYRAAGSPNRTSFMPFNSANKYSYAQVEKDGNNYCLIKGAPERLLVQASFHWDSNGNKVELTAEMKKALDDKMLELASNAMRMIALCTHEDVVDDAVGLPETGITLLGILAIRDDVRPEAVEAIHAVQEAGVQIVMITGDRKETAVAIARDSGILKNDNEIVWTSEELAAMTDEEIKLHIKDLRVVSRALPMDKSRLVRISQECDLVVGMTGDGVNDSPALKKADVGFAMGSGTEVAKEAGDIVILDDNFLSIKQAILYGRTIYNSICKFIMFQLTINLSAVAINIIAPFIGIDKPLTIVQILWINLVMDTLAALAFGGEPALDEYLDEKPKRRDLPIVSKQMAITIVTGAIYMTVIAIAFYKSAWVDSLFRDAPDHIYTYTGFFCAYIFMAVANGFNVRVTGINIFHHLSKNKGFIEVMALIIVIQVILTYIGGSLLRTTPLLMNEWFVVIVAAISVIVVDVIRKIIFKALDIH